jgi:hypothetical protein
MPDRSQRLPTRRRSGRSGIPRPWRPAPGPSGCYDGFSGDSGDGGRRPRPDPRSGVRGPRRGERHRGGGVLLEALKVTDVDDRVRQAAETIYRALIEAELTEAIGTALHEHRYPRGPAQRAPPRVLSTRAGVPLAEPTWTLNPRRRTGRRPTLGGTTDRLRRETGDQEAAERGTRQHQMHRLAALCRGSSC